jgi:hypothetical protein
MPKKLSEVIDITNPEFLKEYEGRYINSPEGVYSVSGGKISPAIANEQFYATRDNPGGVDYQSIRNKVSSFSDTGGLQPGGKDEYKTSEAFRYFGQASIPQEQIASNFGMGSANNQRLVLPAGAPPLQTGSMPTGYNGDTTFNIAGMKTEGRTPYYGSLQDLANQGLQVSGGKVYENGQVIGTYAGISTPTSDYVSPTIQTAPTIAGQNKQPTGSDLILPNGQVISASDPNNAQYAGQMGVMRKLGSTEFNALNTQWGQAGLTTQETLDNFLVKKGNDYYLKTDAPSAEQVIANRKAKDKASGAGGTGGTNIDGTPKSTPGSSVDDIITEYNNSLADEKAAASLAGQLALSLKAELDAMKKDIDFNNVLNVNQKAAVQQAYQGEKSTLEHNPNIDTMAGLNGKLNKMITDMNQGLQNLDIANSVKEAENVYKYNTKLIEYNLAQGRAELAQKQTQMAADEFWKFQGLRLDLLQRQDTIDARTADDLRQAAQDENAMAKEGYVFLTPANKDAMTLKYGTDKIYTNPVNGKSYLKPTEETWSAVFSLGGDLVQKNTKTGEIRVAVNVAAGAGGGGNSAGDNLSQYYAGQIRSGILDITMVPDKYQKAVADELAKPQVMDYSGATFKGLTVTLKNGASKTFANQAELDSFKKDNGYSGTAPATAPAKQPKPVAPIYGKNNFSKVSIDTKLSELQAQNKSWGLGSNVGLREELYNMGYPLTEIDRRLHPIATTINDFISNIIK